jgi:energy-converting hydrogenase Eha subunit C
MYRYVAHDPFLRRGLARYVDGPITRYRRILVPGLAFIVAGGRQDLIDRAYIAVVAMFVLLGAYWLSRSASLEGFHPACGLAFLLVPATLVSMDRMTVDVALAALAIGLAWYWKSQSTAKLCMVLVLACLVRETGVLLVAACCLVDLRAKRFRRAGTWATTCLPLAVWYLFLRNKVEATVSVGGVPRWVYKRIGPGIIGRLLHPIHYPFTGPMELLVQTFDVIALTGIVCAIVAAVILLRLRPLDPVSVAAFLFAVLAIALVSVRYWDLCYSYARVFSPLLIFTALAVDSKHRISGWWWTLVPTAMVDLRIGLELGSQTLGILRGLSGR